MTIHVVDITGTCPPLDDLEGRGPNAAEVRAHVASCPGCALVAGVLATTHQSAEDCVRFEPLIAARAEGTLGNAGRNLLARHLASCGACREIVESLASSLGDAIADAELDASADRSALPEVDPATYSVGLEVARGGMGRILAARDLRVGRAVAIKELLHQAPQLAARFEREARITARLQHPGIVPIYEIGRWPDGTPFYTMRLVKGTTLREAIEPPGGKPRSLAERITLLTSVIAACEAVAFAHEHRVVHRDLTPSNILVGAFGETVVIDWGLAKDAEVDDLAIAGTVMGTAAYMPPEQASGAEVDARADVYALGAILYHVLAGASPYRGRAGARGDLLAAVRAGPPPALAELEPRAPGDLASIVAKAMARDPDARYASAGELADELRRYLAGRMVEAHAYTRGELVRRFVRKHRAVLAAVALATVALAAIGIVAVTRIVRARGEAEGTLKFVLEEQGRDELARGDNARALAYLDAAYAQGAGTPSLGFLYANALRGLSSDETTLDCGGGAAHDLAFSTDGKDVAVGCNDVAKIWHLGTPGDPIVLPRHTGGFDMLTYSHDGSVLATWGTEGIARLWDAKTGEPRGEIAHGAGIKFTTFTPDDARVLTSGGDGAAKLWARTNLAAPVRTIVVSSAGRDVYGVLSRDGKTILTTTIDGDARGWDAETGAQLGGFQHGSIVIGGEVAMAGPERSVSCGVDKLVKLWDANTGESLHVLAGHSDVVFACKFSPDGTRVLSTSHDGTARVWDAATGTLVTSATDGDSIWTGHFSPDGHRFLTVDLGGYVRVWDAHTGLLLATHDNAGGKEAKFSPDNTRIVALRGDGRISVWANSAGALRASFAPKSGIAIGTGLDGTRAVVRDTNGVVLWDVTSGARVPHATPLAEPIALGDTALVAGTEVVDLATGNTLANFPLGAPPYAASIASEGARVAFATGDGVEVWDVKTVKRVALFAGARSAKLDARGTRIALETPGGVRVGSATGGPNETTVAIAGSESVRLVGFAAGGAVLVGEGAVHGATRDAIAWDATTGAVVHQTTDAIATSLDPGHTLVTTIGADRVVRVWRAIDGATIATFVGGGQLLSAQSDPTGDLVVAIAEHGAAAVVMASHDGRVLARWPIEHALPTVTQAEIIPAHAEARWARDGAGVTTIGTTVALWYASRQVVAGDRARVAHHVPWRVVDGRVQLVRARMHGSVTTHGDPLAHAEVAVAIRRPPVDAGGSYTWDVIRSDIKRTTATTNGEGDFELRDLVLGEYAVTVGGKTTLVQVDGDDRDIAIEIP